ncbi:MAG: hypothetical protein IPH82_11050 [Chloroflexi bacterium]|nr:hypothetical protein [Chloroflexota bacterium]
MSDENEGLVSQPVVRCPRCDSVVAFEATVCLMCGAAIPPQLAGRPNGRRRHATCRAYFHPGGQTNGR